MDHGLFDFGNMTTVDLEGTGTSTHLGKIVSTGVFENVGNRRSGGFKGEIEGSSTSVLVPSPSPTVAGTAPGAATATPTPTNGKPNAITCRLSAEFFPGVPGVFYGIGTYRITGGSDAFEGAKGFGEFIGLADLRENVREYYCFLSGVIFY